MKFDAYEYTGVILPGAVVVLTASLLFPEVKDMLGKDGVSLGGLGVFVVASFVVGHIVQALGNTIEWFGAGVYGQGRSDVILSPDQSLIAPSQRDRLRTAVLGAFHVDLDGMKPAAWSSIRREMYAHVKAAGATERIDAFNRTYGLQRGLTAGLFAAAAMILLVSPLRWPVAAAMIFGVFLALFRMRRFSDHYARELIVEYLRLSKPATASRPSVATEPAVS
jgi:hypothetical protein